MMGPLSPMLPKARIIATTLFACPSDTSDNQDTTSSRTAEIWRRVSEGIGILLDVLMGRSSSKRELPETLPSDGLSDSTGPPIDYTCCFREASFRRPWASASKTTPRTCTTVLVQLHERGTDVITPPCDDYLLPFFDTNFRPPSP